MTTRKRIEALRDGDCTPAAVSALAKAALERDDLLREILAEAKYAEDGGDYILWVREKLRRVGRPVEEGESTLSVTSSVVGDGVKWG